MTSPYSVLADAAKQILAIEDARAGRSRTRSQDSDYQTAGVAFVAAINEIEATGDPYTVGLARHAVARLDEGDQGDLTRLISHAAQLNRLEGFQELSRAIESDTPDRGKPSMSASVNHIGDIYTERALAGDVVDGSNVVAKDYSDELWSRLYRANPLLSAGLTTFETTDYSFVLPIGTASVTVSLTGQGTAITASDPGFTQREIIPQRFGALTAVSNEFWADISDAQRDYIVTDQVRAIGDSMEAQMLTGTGSPGFTGLYGTNAAGTVTGGTVTATGLVAYATAMGTAAANNIEPTHWIVSPTDYMQLVKVTEGGTAVDGSLRPLLTPALNAGGAAVNTLYGLPVLVTPNASAGTALLISAPQLIFVRRTSAETLVDPYSLSNTYQTRLRAVVRAGFYGIPGRFVRINSLA